MSGVAVTADRALHVLLLDAVPRRDRRASSSPITGAREFATWDDDPARAGPAHRRADTPATTWTRSARELPAATIVHVRQPRRACSIRVDPPLDAIVLTAERGSAYTLLHPEYSVVVPKPRPVKVPLALRDRRPRRARWPTVIDTWIDLKRKDGTIDELFAHWILGRDAAPHQRRWSILDDVLR